MNNKIELSYEMSEMVNKELISKNIRNGEIKRRQPEFKLFSNYELDSIDELTLSGFEDINDLKYFRNLVKLELKSLDFNKIAPYVHYNESQYVNKITDFKVINSLSKLNTLVIANDLNIKSLNISSLKDLNNIVIINNPNLRVLEGLDQLKNLKDVLLYGNNIDGSNFDIDSYMINTRLCLNNYLDISMYNGIIKADSKRANDLMLKQVSGDTFLRFTEKCGFLDCVSMSPTSLSEMFKGFTTYFKKNNVYNMSDYDKIILICNYVKNHVTFDKSLILERNLKYEEFKVQFDDIPEHIRKTLNNFHCSYYAYKIKKANCEGRVNLIVFMCKMLGIEARNVHCHDNRSNIVGSNHSIARVKIDGVYRYIDITLLGKDSLFLVDYNKMSEYVTLDSYEKSLYDIEVEMNGNNLCYKK